MTIVSKDVQLAASVLKKGGVVAYPTESSYALGCDATNLESIRKIYLLKKRPSGKQLTVIIGSIKTAERYTSLTKDEMKIAKNLMPGRITLVTKTKKCEFAFRIPNNKTALKLAKAFGKPVTATSANISGEKPIYSTKGILKLYGNKIDMILDGGNLPRRSASTVVDLFDGINIRRKGPVTKKMIEDVL